MSSTDVAGEGASEGPAAGTVEMKLEVVVVPSRTSTGPRPSMAAWAGARMPTSRPMSFGWCTSRPQARSARSPSARTSRRAFPARFKDLQLTVFDIDAARAELIDRGVDVGEVFHDTGGVFHHAGTDERVPGLAPDRASYGSFAAFSDPDGNGWLLQEINEHLPGR
jgi:hypothetical protein